MAEVVIINPRATDPFVKVRAVLKNPRRALEMVGQILEAAALDTFEDQAFGKFNWLPNYPGMADPFINVAGSIADFATGASEPKPRRFQDRPANIDTGALASSPKARISGKRTVEVGSTHPAAALAQWGGTSSQPVTQPTKNSIATWLLKKGEKYRPKLLPVLAPSLTSWDTDVVQRPFLGVTEQTEKDIVRAVEEMIAEEIGK